MDQIKRSEGQSVVASAAYRAGEKLHSEYYGEDSDYTNKGGVIYTEIFLPPHAPREYADRETLWNAVEKAEKQAVSGRREIDSRKHHHCGIDTRHHCQQRSACHKEHQKSRV